MLHYSPDVYEFIKKHPEMKTRELTTLVNKKFKINVSYKCVYQWQRKYIKGYIKPKCPHTWASYELGQEFKNGNYICIKTETGCIQKHRYIWEQHYGPIKPGEVVIFLDGDRSNFDIDNLCCISRRHFAIVNKILKDANVPPELKKTVINYAILKVTTSDHEWSLKGIYNPQRFYRFTEIEKKIIKLHREGKTNIEIVKTLKNHPSCVSEAVRKYKLGYFDRFYEDKAKETID